MVNEWRIKWLGFSGPLLIGKPWSGQVYDSYLITLVQVLAYHFKRFCLFKRNGVEVFHTLSRFFFQCCWIRTIRSNVFCQGSRNNASVLSIQWYSSCQCVELYLIDVRISCYMGLGYWAPTCQRLTPAYHR